MIFEPGEPGSGVQFSDEIVGGRSPREFIPSVEYAIRTECKRGQIAGYEVVDFNARLIDGKYHDVDSSALAFEIAGRAMFREAHKASKPKLLEPIMRVEVVLDADYLGEIIGDFNRRRGSVTEQGQKGLLAFVRASSRWRKCSATSTTCARPPAAAAPSRWSSTTTPKCRPAWSTS
jgi:elongation factor G